jgi:undecaprenyl-diphosphatase
MDLIQVIVLGIVQGLGEFLPISSSGHLVLAPWFFGWRDQGLSFDVALHFGTLIAVGAYFWKDWVRIIGLLLGKEFFGESEKLNYPRNIFWYLVAATIPGALAGFFLDDLAENKFRHPLLVASMLAIVGAVLYFVDRNADKNLSLGKIKFKDALFVGLIQALAIVPGVSRSGSTIAAARFLGYDRVSSARFSFLLSTPIIFGAAIFKLDDFLLAGVHTNDLVGILVAAVSGYLAIAVLLKLVEKVSYAVFFWYRLILALIIVMMYFVVK